MEMSQEIKEIAKAMNKLQGELDFAVKDVQAFKYKYADLAAIWAVLKEPLTRNGLMISQDAYTNELGACVQTIVVHAESGQWFKSGVLNVPGDKTAHSCGSSITYAKRYQLSAILGVQVDADDDGAKANAESQKKTVTPLKPKIKEFSQKEMDAWVQKWSEKYSLADIEEFCQARADHFSHSIQMTCAELAQDEKIFVKNIDTWLKKNSGEKS